MQNQFIMTDNLRGNTSYTDHHHYASVTSIFQHHHNNIMRKNIKCQYGRNRYMST